MDERRELGEQITKLLLTICAPRPVTYQQKPGGAGFWHLRRL